MQTAGMTVKTVKRKRNGMYMDEFRRFMRERKLTQVDIGNAIGVSRNTVQVKMQTFGFTCKEAMEICKAFGIYGNEERARLFMPGREQ